MPRRGPITSRDGTVLAEGTGSSRRYPQKTLASLVVGYTNKHSHAVAGKTTGGGQLGIERKYDAYLAGKSGRPAIPGDRVVLTIDAQLQRAVEAQLAKYEIGAAVIINVATGDVLAMASMPSLDLSQLNHRAYLTASIKNPGRLFRNKAVQSYRVGFSFAPFSAIAAVQTGTSSANAKHVCTGAMELGRYRFKCSGQHGRVGLGDALANGCRLYFWKLASATGLDTIATWARDFGFGVNSKVLFEERPGQVPDKAWYERHTRFRAGFTLNTSIGLGDLEVTPLQLARAYAALANGGRILVPQLVSRIVANTGATVWKSKPTLVRRLVLAKAVTAAVHRGLVQAAHNHAAPHLAAVASVVGPKSPRARAKDAVWLAGYAPHDAPKIAIALFIRGKAADEKAAWAIAAAIARAAAATR